MISNKLLTVAPLFVFWLAACTNSSGVTVTKQELGDKWPLTVDSAKLECRNSVSPGMGAAIAHVNGKTYALNGLAKQKGYPDIRPVWRDDPKIPGAKVSISPLIKRALDLCK